MTALISAFARAWHAGHVTVPVYRDTLAERLLGPDYAAVAGHMAAGAAYFLPGFQGTQEEALQQIVCRQLAPSPLGRAAFCEEHLRAAAAAGCTQYLLLGAGYDTLPYRQPEWLQGMTILELDHPVTAADKLARLNRAGIAVPENVIRLSADLTDPAWPGVLLKCPGFRRDAPTFVSLLGLVYYLPSEAFTALLGTLAGTFCGIVTSSRLTTYRIEQLEKKVSRHKSVIERTYILEGQMTEAQHDIRDLKSAVKPGPQ